MRLRRALEIRGAIRSHRRGKPFALRYGRSCHCWTLHGGVPSKHAGWCPAAVPRERERTEKEERENFSSGSTGADE